MKNNNKNKQNTLNKNLIILITELLNSARASSLPPEEKKSIEYNQQREREREKQGWERERNRD